MTSVGTQTKVFRGFLEGVAANINQSDDLNVRQSANTFAPRPTEPADAYL